MQKIPAFKYLLFLSIGLMFGIVIKLDLESTLLLLSSVIVIVLLSLKFDKLRMLYPFFVMISGIILFQNIHIQQFKYPDKIVPEFRAVIKGKVLKVQSARNNAIRLMFEGDFDPTITDELRDVRLMVNIYGHKVKRLNLAEGDVIRANVWVRMPKKSNIPGEFDERQYALSSGFQFFAKTNASQVSIIDRAKSFNAFINTLRTSLKSRIDILFNSGNAGIIKALLTGDKSQIDRNTKLTFSHTGTAHVLAISGLHIGIISSIILLFLSFVPLRIFRFIIFATLLSVFIVLTGAHPSSIRAGLMAVLIYLAWIAQRKINLLNILSLAVIIILFVQSQMIYSVGFQMSVLALLGITLLYEPIKKFLDSIIKSKNYLTKFLKLSLTLTFAVTITVSPIVAYYFGYYSYVSPLANLFVVPLITLVLIYAILSVTFSYIFIPFAYWLSADTDALLDLIKWLNSIFIQAGVFVQGRIPVVIFSIAISLALFYLFKATNKKQMVFRLLISGIYLILIFFIFEPRNEREINVFPRNNVVAIKVSEPQKDMFLILDRKNKKFIKSDFALIKYIASSNKAVKVVYTGRAGRKVVQAIKQKKHIKVQAIDLNEAEYILNSLGLNNRIYQRIEL